MSHEASGWAWPAGEPEPTLGVSTGPVPAASRFARPARLAGSVGYSPGVPAPVAGGRRGPLAALGGRRAQIRGPELERLAGLAEVRLALPGRPARLAIR